MWADIRKSPIFSVLVSPKKRKEGKDKIDRKARQISQQNQGRDVVITAGKQIK